MPMEIVLLIMAIMIAHKVIISTWPKLRIEDKQFELPQIYRISKKEISGCSQTSNLTKRFKGTAPCVSRDVVRSE